MSLGRRWLLAQPGMRHRDEGSPIDLRDALHEGACRQAAEGIAAEGLSGEQVTEVSLNDLRSMVHTMDTNEDRAQQQVQHANMIAFTKLINAGQSAATSQSNRNNPQIGTA